MSDSLLRQRLHVHRPLARDFGAFLRRGNVADLAIGVVIGAAFGKIVSSFVGDIITPPLGLLIDEVNFSALRLRIGGTAVAPVTINYGMFLQTLLDFAIIGVALFGLSRLINRFRRGRTAALTKDQELLAEIRDLLRPGRTNPAVTSAPTTD
ncbi:MAG: large conductance mechanosensitive channel protein MscL [Opitutae bacterium]|nr:large conductance mechanosensitive channel protein MscL [Opitutae bacterium]